MPPERRLAETLNVSRTVVRQALSDLIDEGLLVRQSPRILCIAEYDRQALAQQLAPINIEEARLQSLIELRAFIEIGAIESIVRLATSKDLERIEHWVREGEFRIAANEPLNIVDARFHAALLRTLGNPALESMLPLIEETLRRNVILCLHQFHTTGTSDDFRVVAEHRQIYEAIQHANVETAQHLMKAHLSGYLRWPNPERTWLPQTEQDQAVSIPATPWDLGNIHDIHRDITTSFQSIVRSHQQ